MTRLFNIFALSFLLLQKSNGYMIDTDCGENTQWLQDRIDAGFDMMRDAVTKIEQNDPQANSMWVAMFGQPHSSIQQMFDTALPRLRKLDQISQYTQQTDHTSYTPGLDNVDTNIIDVRFYCTWDRIGGVLPSKLYNKYRFASDGVTSLSYKDALDSTSKYSECRSLGGTQALTVTFTGMYTEVQICPWYLNEQRKLGFPAMLKPSNQPLFRLGSKIMQKIHQKFSPRPDIDLFMMIENTIVHELQHVSQGVHRAVDQPPNPYGFKSCAAKAQAYIANPSSALDPQMNADNVSIFVLGTFFTDDGTQIIDSNGNFQSVATPSPGATPAQSPTPASRHKRKARHDIKIMESI